MTSDGLFYGAGGLLFDVLLGPVVITPSLGVGLLEEGDSRELGSVIEFRSMLEIGYAFDNGMRLTGQLSHISNAGLTETNPGVNILGAYLHVPESLLTGG